MSEQEDSSKSQPPTSSTNNPYTPNAQQPIPSQTTTKSQSTSGPAKSSSDQLKEFLDFIGDFFEWLGVLLVSGIKSLLAEIDKARVASSQNKRVPEELSNQNIPVTDQPGAIVSPLATSNSQNVNNLGYYLDGWADLIEGMGEKVSEVRTKTLEGLRERNMPAIKISQIAGYVTELGGERREYGITQTSPGATTTIYISNHGKDLYTSWRTFIKPVLNILAILVMFVIAGTLGIIALANEVNVREFSDYINYFDRWFSFTGWVLRSILVLLFEFLIVAVVGRVMKGNFLAYFFIEPTVFDAEDITAMSLSAHKTLLRALDSSGIDVTKLRLKQNFKGGRRDEMI